MAAVLSAFPFIEVKIQPPPPPVAQRAPGVIAIVGKTPADAAGGTAALNKPIEVDDLATAANLFAKNTPLYSSIELALKQDPRASKIYGVRVDQNKYDAALSALEAADDVTFVSLANETDVGNLGFLKAHAENMSAQGNRRMGVAMIDPKTAKSNTYVATVTGVVNALKSTSSRMIMVAARGFDGDAATAAMSAIAGYEPHISIVLKKIRAFQIPLEQQYSPAEIKGLSEAGIIPIIDPALITGESLHFADGRAFTSDASLLFIDLMRTLDDIEFRLKAGLIGLIGDARITKLGMTQLKTKTEGILGGLKNRNVIDNYVIDLPILNILNVPEASWSPADRDFVRKARDNRIVDMYVTIFYGPAVHRLLVQVEVRHA